MVGSHRSIRRAARLFPLAVSMLAEDGSPLRRMVTPRMPWERAAEAFEMYCHPAEHEGTLKLALEL